MKKMVIGITTIFILAIFVVAVINIKKSNALKNNYFDVKDYDYYIENFSSDENVGDVLTAEQAKQKAELLWTKLYGEEIKDKKPYIVYFDTTNDVWMVKGSLKNNTLGGVPYIIIQKSNGKVLAVWHEK